MSDASTEPRRTPTVAVVVAAHGSRVAAANQSHRDLVEQLRHRGRWDLSVAFLELAEPSIAEAIDQVAPGVDRVLVLPFFLHPGRHLDEDIPALVAEADARHSDTSVELLGAFGADPGVVDLLADQLARATTAEEGRPA